jgi:hypothetical protein
MSSHGFNMTVVHHIIVLNCVNGYQKIVLDAELVVYVKLQFPGLHAHLIPFDFFLWGYVKAKVHASRVDAKEELWCRIKQFSSETKNTPRIFKCL